MTRRASPESDAVDAGRCRVYLRPYPGRIPVRMHASAEVTGIPEDSYRALAGHGCRWFWLEREAAHALLARLVVSLEARAPWRALWLRRWVADGRAPGETLAQRIGVVQARLANAEAARRHHAVAFAIAARAATVVLAAFLSARVATATHIAPIAASLATGALAWWVARTERAPFGRRHPVLVAWALGPLPLVALARGGTAAAEAASGLLGVSALGFVAWQLALYLDAPAPPSLSDGAPRCPHAHYSGARAPSAYPDCQLLEGPDFLDLERLWHDTPELLANRNVISFPFGGFVWPVEYSAEHGVVVGVSGSGKTITLLQVFAALAPHMLSVFCDHKRTNYSAIVGAMPGGEEQVALLYPLDQRGKAWALSRDITNPLAAYHFACSLTRGAEREDFWKRTGIDGITAIIITLIRLGLVWTLLSTDRIATPKLLKRFLQQSPEGEHYLETILTSESRVGDRPGDVLATIASFLSRLRPAAIAAERLHEAGRDFSIAEWERGETIERAIVLANNPLYAEALNPYNQALASQTWNRLLAHPERHAIPRALVAIDEAQAGPDLGVSEVLTNGREKGVTVWLATQDIPGLAERLGSRLSRDTNSCALRGHLLLRTSLLVLPLPSSCPAAGGRSPGGRTAFIPGRGWLPRLDRARAAGSFAR